METPSFGEKSEMLVYKKRLGAYIIISRNNGTEIVLIQAPNGAYFLPGGEIELGETKETAIHREMIEELGFEVVIGDYLGQADEYFHSRHRNTDYHNPGYFFVADSWREISEPLEKTNTIRWVSIDEGVNLLKRGSHKWAVHRWRDNK
ncbi:NUDIX hydrolase [Enterococcus plantarum]|uniref:NUDIX domain-containing protein n=1 Tax=Enterococcus plantarum TaxID=1077675 RepID=A0A2W3ZQ06_9ENTE|nr:NUDIX hydrolase [Enterococcus plantarum]MBO0468708.1 NUDIX hydrolase [Enterococcus plantarum]OEG20997.1 NUDIX hydrolase [Enterococcus plantarum]PZL76224.1 NUDIX domain-containing protein [Enterococcus plantarum]